MKKCCFLLTALFLLFAGTAVAQRWSSPQLITNVPFDFVVNDTTLPAGTYIVKTHTTGYALMIQNRDHPEHSTMVNNNIILLAPRTTHDSAKLVFSLNNGEHVLHQVKLQGDDHSHDIIHGTDVAELVE